MITFAQGSLGFMCNFTFEDHPKVFRQLFTNEVIEGKPKPSAVIAFEKRLRLKVNLG